MAKAIEVQKGKFVRPPFGEGTTTGKVLDHIPGLAALRNHRRNRLVRLAQDIRARELNAYNQSIAQALTIVEVSKKDKVAEAVNRYMGLKDEAGKNDYLAVAEKELRQALNRAVPANLDGKSAAVMKGYNGLRNVVAAVQLAAYVQFGAKVRGLEVKIDPEKLSAYQLTLALDDKRMAIEYQAPRKLSESETRRIEKLQARRDVAEKLDLERYVKLDRRGAVADATARFAAKTEEKLKTLRGEEEANKRTLVAVDGYISGAHYYDLVGGNDLYIAQGETPFMDSQLNAYLMRALARRPIASRPLMVDAVSYKRLD